MGFENYKPIVVMVVCQFIYSGVTLSVRAALLQEMSSRVFVVYRQSVAFFLIAPLALFSRRGTKGCNFMGWKTFWLISLLSFVGVTVNQNVYFEGLYLSSSSAASALANLVPAITFIMAYILGLEKVHLRSMRSIAKIIGTVICVSGAAAMALLKGPKLLNMQFHHQLPTNSSLVLFLNQGDDDDDDTWFLGCLFLLGSTLCWSIWLILQVHVTSCYPDHLSLTAWMCLIAAVQSGIVTLIVEPNTKTWKLTSALQLICCFYAGLGSAVTFFAQAWCIARRGPLFSAMFNPLCTVIVTVLACIFMHEELYTGSMLGGLAVIIGLYVVLWGKAKDHEDVIKEDQSSQLVSENTISCIVDLEVPLLTEKPATVN